ncbi:MAG: T9SS type A sorting domain-containing protein [Bacteroidales bacterium]|nr:T9SS type A sorting domain-containing protein [Bacteroidales bacterium]
MKHKILTLLICLSASLSFAGNQLTESFEYGNHDLGKPVGWVCDDNTWLCGFQEKDNNRIPHSGDWYAFTESDEAWMFMPFSLFQRMNYRFYFWAISEGDFGLSLWAGSAPNAESMHSLLLETNVESGVYEQFSVYVDEVPSNCQYIGIQSIKKQNGVYVTIDDIEIDMVEQYSFEVHEISGDTAMYPGTTASFRLLVQNTGYDPLHIYMNASDEFFTDIQYEQNGLNYNSFPTEPNEIVYVTVTATLKPNIEPGTVAWLDVNFTITCNCSTGLATFWVTPLDLTQTAENEAVEVGVYPNPATDFVTVEAEGLQQVSLLDQHGKILSSVAAEGDSMRLDVSGLKAGVYLISAKTRSTSSFVKSILKM